IHNAAAEAAMLIARESANNQGVYSMPGCMRIAAMPV
ncbi:hypothetical protein Pgy4_41017, partial [Pseudomonas savastanoi pv. glycinea str. race 4]